MKLTDFLTDVGRPVAYYPELRKITGSVTATILLCQFIYWRGKESDPNGWLYKTADEITTETGLSYNEQKTARRDLVAAGMIEEHYARLDHQMRFKLNLETINEQWDLENEISKNGESGKPQFGNNEKPLSLNESEITTEITNIGTTVPKYQPVGIEAKIYAGLPVTEADMPSKNDVIRDTANLVDMGCAGAGALAEAFMRARDILIPESKVKGQRKAAREMLEMGVKPEHVTEATTSLMAKGMTVTDLYSVSKTAIDIANKPEIKSKSHGL